ncbi:hypothetical protein, conserved [Eimeria brunetti]|uniref:Uncharacterized protein n=1 Tax=Eimeria brunetti TaxID=51314 RepID=U6L8F8_9EIME|nr:hypothetical protein, conserved [Eimeria brunetti]
MCILSIGRRLTESSFSRNLAASLGEEECGESEDSGSTASPAGTSSEVQAAIPTPVPSAVDILSPQPGNTELISSVRAAAGASVQMIARTGIPPLWMQRRQTAVKRKGEEQSPVEKQATQIILAPPRVGAQPGPPAPPLDPELDSLIDSVLFGSEPVFSEDFWLRDDGPLHQKADPLAGTRPLALGDDSELPDEGERVEKAVSLLSAAPSTLKSDHELPPNHPQIEKQSKKKGLKRKLEEQNKAERNAKQFSIKTPSDETQLQPQLHPLDPDHDSLLGPILSGGHLFKQFRILHDDPLHPTADYSMSARFPTLEHDSERLYADKASGKALHAPPAAPSTQPSDVNKPGRRKISEGPLPGGASCRRMQRSLPGDVETADTGPPSDATKVSLRHVNIRP